MSAAPGMPYIALSDTMQAFYARRGMWRDGAPAGLLANWTGERCPWTPPASTVQHWTTSEGPRAMAADAEAAPPQAWRTYHQKAQFLRRLRESAERAGCRQVEAPAAARTPDRASGAPFEPLHIPADGTAARRAFVEHVMATVREFVDYTQGSEYAGASLTES